MKRLSIALASLSVFAISANAQQATAQADNGSAPVLQQTLNEAHHDLRSTLDQLAELQAEIQKEKIPLAEELRSLENEVSAKRRELERLQRLRDNSSLSLNQLQQQVKARQDNLDYMSNLLGEYGRALEVRLGGPEREQFQSRIKSFDQAVADADIKRDEKLMQTLPIMDLGLDRNSQLVNGALLPGDGVLPDGQIVSGKFLIFGPLTYFATDSSAGLAEKNVQGPPHVNPIGEQLDQLVINTIQTGEGTLPIDATLGDAAAIAETKEGVVEHIEKGGIWMIPIILSGLAAMLVGVIKLIQVYRVPRPNFSIVHDVLMLLREGNVEEARERAKLMPGVAREMLIDGVDHAGESDELVEEIMMERLLDVQPRLESMLPFIAVAAATAPLLGLLGTVTGMINTFTLITVFGTGDAKSLSGGISEALITTEYGLIVAIPSLVIHALLSRRVQSILAQLEHVAVSFVNGLNRPTVER